MNTVEVITFYIVFTYIPSKIVKVDIFFKSSISSINRDAIFTCIGWQYFVLNAFNLVRLYKIVLSNMSAVWGAVILQISFVGFLVVIPGF